MSPNTIFPPHRPLDSPIVERVIRDTDNVVYEVGADTVVLAARSELIVRPSVRMDTMRVNEALAAVATRVGAIGGARRGAVGEDEGEQAAGDAAAGLAGGAELWRLKDSRANAIDEARRLRRLVPDRMFDTASGHTLTLPAVSPNHLCIVSPHYAGCPAGPPHPTPVPAGAGDFVGPLTDPAERVRVTIIDTGYIKTTPPHTELDARVTSVRGTHLNHAGNWVPDLPDGIDTDADGRLDGIVGHGTFVAGLIAHLCPAAALTVVGQREEDVPVGGAPAAQRRLYASEFSLANALLTHADADVIQFGFSFPTLDDHPSIPFTSVIDKLTGPDAPRPGVAIVTPAGNEESASPYWPAALPGVIGVGATDRRGKLRARFSNWGHWLECCARGQDVVSTYIYWTGPVEGDPLSHHETFSGWARWNGTSFAAPKVSAAIAQVVADNPGLAPVDAFARIVSRQTSIAVSSVTDYELSGLPGVTLPQLHVH